MTDYRVIEIFESIQGEGKNTGKWCTFIRLAGCDVNCSWCDTQESWSKKNGVKMTANEITKSTKTRNVVITGGEPTLWDLDPLLSEFHRLRHFTMLETSGKHALKGNYRPCWATVSPKYPFDFQIDPFWFQCVSEFKWVVDEHFDIELAHEFERKATSDIIVPLVVLMPEGSPPKPENVERCLQILRDPKIKKKENWLYSDRVQYRIGVP